MKLLLTVFLIVNVVSGQSFKDLWNKTKSKVTATPNNPDATTAPHVSQATAQTWYTFCNASRSGKPGADKPDAIYSPIFALAHDPKVSLAAQDAWAAYVKREYPVIVSADCLVDHNPSLDFVKKRREYRLTNDQSNIIRTGWTYSGQAAESSAASAFNSTAAEPAAASGATPVPQSLHQRRRTAPPSPFYCYAAASTDANSIYFSGIFTSTDAVAENASFEQYLNQKYNLSLRGNDSVCNGHYPDMNAATSAEQTHMDQQRKMQSRKVVETNWAP